MNSDKSQTLASCRSEANLSYARASGPGGQNVNKVTTAVRLHFDVARTTGLDPDARQRLARIAGRRLTAEGVLVLEARRFRTQERNRQDVLERFDALILDALRPPRRRRATQPPAHTKERRLRAKKRRSELKRFRARAVD